MATFNFITIRLGKDSIPDIQKICSSIVGVLEDTFTINVKCTQVPDNYYKDDYAFIWLGSDNNKGMPTKWKQGFKAVGRVKGISRGKSYNDTSETKVEIVYIFHNSINRMDILRCAPVAYYWCSSMPLIGLDDHANQTIRNLSGSTFADIRAFFSSIEDVTNRFKSDIIQVEPLFSQYFDVILPDPQKYPLVKNLDELPSVVNNIGSKRKPLQQIFYGAPGTGKSNTIKRQVDDQKKKCFRTTFHPDSDYSTFVGAYKPSMKPTGVTLASGEKEEIIKYTFVPQAFTKAYEEAWSTEEDVYLIIEEINRGNCAQIFGDLFQLLDRKNGMSEYPIDADSDLGVHIKEALAKSTRTDIPVEVKNGKKLMLPSNLYIWATMNTSDQSLFPIDSAFKRRWDWVYIPIKSHDDENYKIEIGENKYDWWGFLEKINQVIDDTTSSEDKKLGYFFVKAEDKVVRADKFVSKVLFYLWNDVFKNYGFDNPIFSKGDNKKFTFSDFFKKDGTPDTDMVNLFLSKLDETIDKEHSFVEKKAAEGADKEQSEAEA